MVEPCVDAEMDAGDKQLFEHKPSDPFSFHFYEKNVTSKANKESTGTNPRLINMEGRVEPYSGVNLRE